MEPDLLTGGRGCADARRRSVGLLPPKLARRRIRAITRCLDPSLIVCYCDLFAFRNQTFPARGHLTEQWACHTWPERRGADRAYLGID